MFRIFGKIFVNQLKVRGFQFVTDVVLASMAEFNRAQTEGKLDVSRQQKENELTNPFARTEDVKKGGFLNALFGK